MKGKKQILNIITRLILFCTLILLIFLISLIGVILLIGQFGGNSESVKTVDNIFHKYRYFQTNQITKQSNVGIMTIPEKLSNNDFISYNDESGNYVLISNHGMNEYQCTGKCFCQTSDEDERRSSGTTLPIFKSLMYLVAATTTIAAVNIAKEHFVEECEESLFSSSSCNQVYVEIESCMSKKDIYGIIDVEEEEEEVEKTGDKELKEGDIDGESELTKEQLKKFYEEHYDEKNYICAGNCVDNDDNSPDLRTQFMMDYIEHDDCRHLRLEKDVTLSIPKGADISEEIGNEETLAKFEFMVKTLEKFCMRMSSLHILEVMKMEKDEMNRIDGEKKNLDELISQIDERKKDVSFCRGIGGPNEYELNESIECVEKIHKMPEGGWFKGGDHSDPPKPPPNYYH